jgi:hypothetical protein
VKVDHQVAEEDSAAEAASEVDSEEEEEATVAQEIDLSEITETETKKMEK